MMRATTTTKKHSKKIDVEEEEEEGGEQTSFWPRHKLCDIFSAKYRLSVYRPRHSRTNKLKTVGSKLKPTNTNITHDMAVQTETISVRLPFPDCALSSSLHG